MSCYQSKGSMSSSEDSLSVVNGAERVAELVEILRHVGVSHGGESQEQEE